MTKTVSIVDTRVSNVGSVLHALHRLEISAAVTISEADIRASSHVIIPGVGSFDAAVAALREAGLLPVLSDLDQPVLGICLGMQLLGRASEEGRESGLGLVDADTVRMWPAVGVTVPHMGWNTIKIEQPDCALLDGFSDRSWFYFAHSFCQPRHSGTIATTDHGLDFTAVLRRGNYFGVQFHPEKSGRNGGRLLRNFLNV